MKFNVFLDMDGTIADLYNYPNWLEYLALEEIKPYRYANPLIDLQALSKLLIKTNLKINILSWTSKDSSVEYSRRVRYEKIRWLNKHGLNSKVINKYLILPYGTNKEKYVSGKEYDVLFDDDINNRKKWMEKGGFAYDEKNILEILKILLDTF